MNGGGSCTELLFPACYVPLVVPSQVESLVACTSRHVKCNITRSEKYRYLSANYQLSPTNCSSNSITNSLCITTAGKRNSKFTKGCIPVSMSDGQDFP